MGVHMKKTRFHDERGATAVLMAFGMVGLLAFGGLVLDGGNAFSQRRQMQNAADAAATAGANELYRYKTRAIGTGDVYARPATSRSPTGPRGDLHLRARPLRTTGAENRHDADCQGASPHGRTGLEGPGDGGQHARHDAHARRQHRQLHGRRRRGGGAASPAPSANAPFMSVRQPGTAHAPPLPRGRPGPIPPAGRSTDLRRSAHDRTTSGATRSRTATAGLGEHDFRGLVDNGGSYTIPGDGQRSTATRPATTWASRSSDGCDMDGGHAHQGHRGRLRVRRPALHRGRPATRPALREGRPVPDHLGRASNGGSS